VSADVRRRALAHLHAEDSLGLGGAGGPFVDHRGLWAHTEGHVADGGKMGGMGMGMRGHGKWPVDGKCVWTTCGACVQPAFKMHIPHSHLRPLQQLWGWADKTEAS